MRRKEYYSYWIKLIEKWFERKQNLTKEDFLKLQQLVEGLYKLDEVRDYKIKKEIFGKEDLKVFLGKDYVLENEKFLDDIASFKKRKEEEK